MKFKKIGIGFIILGLIEIVISGISCRSLCTVCNSTQVKPCFFLFIFVGIIFIVSGLSIISLQETRLPSARLVKKKR